MRRAHRVVGRWSRCRTRGCNLPSGGKDTDEHHGTNSPLDAAALLDVMKAFLRRFVVFPCEEDAVTVVLLLAHTLFIQVFDNGPALALLSIEPGSGKSRCMEILTCSCYLRCRRLTSHPPSSSAPSRYRRGAVTGRCVTYGRLPPPCASCPGHVRWSVNLSLEIGPA